MIYRNRRLREVPMLNTASLPDLIFTVLFFFMIVTHMRKATVKVRYTLPQGTEVTRLTKKTAVSYIYIGKPMEGQPSVAVSSVKGGALAIQLNDKWASIDEVPDYVSAEKQRMGPADQQRMTISVKADRATPMWLVDDVKQAVRQGGATRINYSAEQAK